MSEKPTTAVADVGVVGGATFARQSSHVYEVPASLEDGARDLPPPVAEADAPPYDKEHNLELGNIDFEHFDVKAYLTMVLERARTQGKALRRMGLAFDGLTVKGRGSGVGQGRTLGSTLGALPLAIMAKVKGHGGTVTKTILQDLTGYVKPGQMLLVLGTPGSGCTTFLRTVSAYTEGFQAVEGEITYAGYDAKDVQHFLRGDVVYCAEDDIHFPTLTTEQTIAFAVQTRAPPSKIRMALNPDSSRRKYGFNFVNALGAMLGLRRVFDTKVGNDIIRGISGGQRKRVSIAEVLAAHARIASFDNSTRGLDAATAVDFVRSIRGGTQVNGVGVLCTLYQAGDSIVKLFDNVTVLYLGRQVFFGPVNDAVRYFHELGFERRAGQSIGDYLVSVTDPGSRALRPGFEGKAPLDPDAMARAWRASTDGEKAAKDSRAYIEELRGEKEASGQAFVERTRQEKSKRLSKNSKYSVSFGRQVRLALVRRYQMFMGNLPNYLIVLCSTIFQSLITGSVYYGSKDSTSSLFSRSGVLFFALLLNALQAMSEVAIGYAARPVMIRQARFGMIRPSADVVANMILSIPARLVIIVPFSLVIYFMTGLSRTADAFFIFFFTVALSSFTMIAYFRMLTGLVGNVSKATMISGLSVLVMILYTGYMIPRPSMVVWWKWLSYVNPLAYGYEILITNEFRKLSAIPCASLVPAGPAYAGVSLANQVCTVPGSAPGSATVDGPTYLSLQYGYTFDHAGRNAGIMIAFWVFFLIVHAVGSEHQKDPLSTGGQTIFKRGKQPPAEAVQGDEAADSEKPAIVARESYAKDKDHDEEELTDTFAWENVFYDVPVGGGTRRLLNDVSGYVKPGTLTALMGESGAGKTTLLNVLARRTDVGVVSGSFTVDGGPLPASFQADTGYVQQQDNHLPSSTVREALEFSALLRQPANVSRADKLAWVDEVMRMLQMETFADALVGQVGAGLSVEQRKRLTIGVELAARPKLLLFLDEPSSGLSAQASWSIIQFLRRLADAGQAILCTIHQPSGELINQFDRLLLLRRGGETVYFGDLGVDSSRMIEYFSERSGIQCPREDNPAEYMLDVIAGPTKDGADWHQTYLKSELQSTLVEDLARIKAHANAPADPLKGYAKPSEYSTSFFVQFNELARRTARHYWRSADYMMGKIALNLLAGLFVGSTFWNAGGQTSVASLQSKVFGVFMALILSAPLAQQAQGFFIAVRDVFESREKPSKAYSWYAMLSAFIVIELPWNLLGGTLFWVPWFLMIQYIGSAAFSWFSLILFSLWWPTFATAVACMANEPQVASVLFSALFSFVLIFCGVTQPPPQMPAFWNHWIIVVSPFTYLVEMLMGNSLNDAVIRCQPEEFSTIIPPAGQSCAQYLRYFSSNLTTTDPIGVGYYVDNPDGTCGFCPYRVGDDFWQQYSTPTYTYASSHRFRDIGIEFIFIAFNFVILFSLFYLFRIARLDAVKARVKAAVGRVRRSPK